jgi:hypothetical protein
MMMCIDLHLAMVCMQGEVEGIERTQGRTDVLVDEGSAAVNSPALLL